MDRIIASRKIDPELVVSSPIAGQVTAFNAPPGLFVQPGNAPAPYTVANVTVKWLLADVSEGDIPAFRPGQPLQVKVTAYPNRDFKGKISKVYENVDPNTHRETVRAEISDPKNELRPGMLATFVINVQAPCNQFTKSLGPERSISLAASSSPSFPATVPYPCRPIRVLAP
jgi:cobalt-zinc-cadmium efflux system membrane fusion protein